MTKGQASDILRFIRNHYDYVDQVSWYDLCDMLVETVIHDANRSSWGKQLSEEFPDFIEATPVAGIR